MKDDPCGAVLKGQVCLLTSAFCLALAAASAPAGAQSYPAKPVRWIVPFAAGGGVDFIARLIAPKLSEALGQQLVIENRGGAGSAIGTELALRSAPDGYTLLQTSPSYVINPSLNPTKLDPLSDYTPIVLIGKGPFVAVAHPSLPARDARQLIALAKSRPGQIAYGSSGQGTIVHLSTELFFHMAGIRLHHVPYKGGAPALVDVMAGHVQLVFAPPQTGLPHVKSGRVRALGMTGAQRLPTEPGIPALAETVPGYEATNWHIVIGPKALPRAVVDRIGGEVRRVIAQKDIEGKLHAGGVFADGAGTPEQVSELVRRDHAQWAKVIKQAGIKAE